MESKHADVQEIGLGKNEEGKIKAEISIEEIRQLQHSANLPPFEGKCRVYIIDGAEGMSNEAANCLLKTLEEPLDKVAFILLTAKERLLPETVISRCQRLELKPLPVEEVRQALIERWKLPAGKADLLARLSHGCLGWAVNNIDDNQLEQYKARMEEIIATTGAGLEERFEYAAELATEFGQSREKVQDKLLLWLDWWHDLMLTKCKLEEKITNIDRQETLKKTAGQLELKQIRETIDAITEAGVQLKLNANARLTLEVLMLSLPASGRTEGHLTTGKAK
jgi:DNA polymerase-3 subunit delta'